MGTSLLLLTVLTLHGTLGCSYDESREGIVCSSASDQQGGGSTSGQADPVNQQGDHQVDRLDSIHGLPIHGSPHQDSIHQVIHGSPLQDPIHQVIHGSHHQESIQLIPDHHHQETFIGQIQDHPAEFHPSFWGQIHHHGQGAFWGQQGVLPLKSPIAAQNTESDKRFLLAYPNLQISPPILAPQPFHPRAPPPQLVRIEQQQPQPAQHVRLNVLLTLLQPDPPAAILTTNPVVNQYNLVDQAYPTIAVHNDTLHHVSTSEGTSHHVPHSEGTSHSEGSTHHSAGTTHHSEGTSHPHSEGNSHHSEVTSHHSEGTSHHSEGTSGTSKGTHTVSTSDNDVHARVDSEVLHESSSETNKTKTAHAHGHH